MGDFSFNDPSMGNPWGEVVDWDAFDLENPDMDYSNVNDSGVGFDIGTCNDVPQDEGLLGVPPPHQDPSPSGDLMQPLFDYPSFPQTLAQKPPPPYARNAVQPTAPLSTTAYSIPPGYALASQRMPGAHPAQTALSTCAPSPYPEATPPTPQDTQADTPQEPQPKKRGRGRPPGSKDKEKRDPKGTHAGKSKGELSRLARERAKKRRRRLEAEQAKKEEDFGQEQEEEAGEQSGSGQQVSAQPQAPIQPPVPLQHQAPVQQPVPLQQPVPVQNQAPVQQPLSLRQQAILQQPLRQISGPSDFGFGCPFMPGFSHHPPLQQQQSQHPQQHQLPSPPDYHDPEFANLEAWAANQP